MFFAHKGVLLLIFAWPVPRDEAEVQEQELVAHCPLRIDVENGLYQSATRFQHLVCLLVQTLGRITYFRLTKLLYLIDLAAIDSFGCSVTGEIYLRQPDGPWLPALLKQLPSLDGMEVLITHRGRLPMIQPGPNQRFTPQFDEQVLDLVAEIIAKYGSMSNSEIKTVAYKTSPMRFVLSEERKGRDMQRFPIIYKDKVAPETDKR